MNKQISQEIIDKLLNKPTKIFEKFHEETKIKANPKQNKSRKIPDAWKTIFYKSYPRLPQIFLPAPKKIILPLMTALKNRRSSRNFGKKPITLEELSTLFYFTSGLNNSKTGSRFYPSAGGRYPIESYVISLNTELSPGLYHYQIKSHALELLVPFKNFKISKSRHIMISCYIKFKNIIACEPFATVHEIIIFLSFHFLSSHISILFF